MEGISTPSSLKKHTQHLPKILQAILDQSKTECVYYHYFPAKEFRKGSKIQESSLHSDLKEYLANNGYHYLYSFQERAIKSIIDGKSTVIVAPTASGKTEAFILPIFQKILESHTEWGGFRSIEREVQAIIMYPTKSLARDQYEKISHFGKALGITVAVFDGDTPKRERLKIRKNPPDILLTNPDILNWHLRNPNSILRAIIPTAKFVVLDELHTYVGAFGSNVYFLIRRLKRILQKAQFIGSSATISNPKDYSKEMFGSNVSIIKCKDGRNSPLHFAILLPKHTATSTSIVHALQTLIQEKRKLLVFANTHRLAELINLLAQERGLYSAVHRAGLPVRYRNLVEQSFKSNELDVLVATPTLELGIDIGTVDGVISALVSYTRLIQRIGRAGRKGQESIALLVLNKDDPISEFYTSKPKTYLSDIDPAYIEPHNERIAYNQILGASCDQPITKKEFNEFQSTIQQLIEDKLIFKTPEGDYVPHWREATRKLKGHSIRGVGDTIYIRHGSRTIGERTMPTALDELHPGAIYFNAGRKYKSKSFSFIGYNGFAQVEPLPAESQHRTTPLSTALPKYLKTFTDREVFGVKILFGVLQITKKVTGFVTKNLYSGAVIREDSLDEPIEYTYNTHGFIFKAPPLPKSVIKPYLRRSSKQKNDLGIQPDFYANPSEEILNTGAYHALEHVLIEGSNMLTGGGSRELGGISIGKTGTIIVHDALPGGSGLSKLLYSRLEEALSRSYTILKNCSCKTIDGCPRCTYSYQCGNNNRPLFKDGALYSAKTILDNVPTQVEIEDYSIFDTFV